MAGYYDHNPNFPPYYQDSSQIPLQSHGYDPRLHQFQALSSDHLSVNYPEYDESSRPLLVAQGSARARRRHIASGEHVKHRRTRSGCYTCRTRRVKCDEAHPVCERCRKGNRDCVYPEPSTTSKSSRSSAKAKDSPQDSGESGDDTEHDEKGALESIPDEEDSPEEAPSDYHRASVSSASQSMREVSDPPSLTYGKSPTPSTEGSNSLSSGSIPQIRPSISSTSSRPSAQKLAPSRSWSDLPPDLLYYINYYRTNMSHYHLFIKNDSTDYMRTTFVEIATRNEPLLYAVVGFAAYHHTLTRPNGKIQDFLKYYNKSISLLRVSIQRNQRQNVATLLTILQLASFEEYLGDWVNLLGHQRAAYEILTSLYTPQTVMQNETLRKILQWYVRFDVYASVMAGCGTILGRDWVAAAYSYYARQALEKPNDIENKFEERIFRSRLLATDIAILFSKKARGTIDDDSFAIECDDLRRQFDSYESQIDPVLRDPSKLVIGFVGSPLQDSDGDMGGRKGMLYGDNVFTTNFLLVDFWAMDLMFKHHLLTAGLLAPADAAGLTPKALKVYNMFEAIARYPHSPPGAVLAAQASLNVASFFLPREEKYNMWTRRNLAKIEALGYIYPTTLRGKISEHWGVDCHWWWLPNDEGLPPIIRTMRKFIEERTMAPKDQAAEDLREMKGIFKFHSLSISDSPGSTESQGTNMDTSEVFTDQSPDGASMPLDDSLLYNAQPDLSWGVGDDRFTGY